MKIGDSAFPDVPCKITFKSFSISNSFKSKAHKCFSKSILPQFGLRSGISSVICLKIRNALRYLVDSKDSSEYPSL